MKNIHLIPIDNKVDCMLQMNEIMNTEKMPLENENETSNLGDVSGSVYLPKQKRVMFKFDDDEPIYLNSIFEGSEFIIKLKEGTIKFEKDGKLFELYVE